MEDLIAEANARNAHLIAKLDELATTRDYAAFIVLDLDANVATSTSSLAEVETRRAALTSQLAEIDDKVLAVWNRGSETAEFQLPVGPELPDGKYADALSGELIGVQSGIAKFSLPPMRCAFFCPEK